MSWKLEKVTYENSVGPSKLVRIDVQLVTLLGLRASPFPKPTLRSPTNCPPSHLFVAYQFINVTTVFLSDARQQFLG